MESHLNIDDSNNDRMSMLRKSIVRVKKHERSFMDIEKEIQKKYDQRMLFLQSQYYGKNSSLIDDFFIIGFNQKTDLP